MGSHGVPSAPGLRRFLGRQQQELRVRAAEGLDGLVLDVKCGGGAFLSGRDDARNLALSHDPQQQHLYVGGGTDIVVVDRKSMEIIGSIEGGGVIGGGHQLGVDSKGNIYVAATNRGLQKLNFKGLAPVAAR